MTNTSAVVPVPKTEADGYQRLGRIFSLRMTEIERTGLVDRMKAAEAARLMPWSRRWHSLGSFIIWAALQWKAPEVEASPVIPKRGRRRAARPATAKRTRKAARK